MREGDDGTHIELLLSGFVKVTNTLASGQEALMDIRGPGDIVGEMGASSNRRRSATVTAFGTLVSVVVARAGFQRFLQEHPQAALAVTAAVGERLTLANERRAEFSAYPAHVRLARLLAEIAKSYGTAGPEGITIPVPLPQHELATMIGAKEAIVHKAMRDLRWRNLISTGYRVVTVLDLDGLRAYAEED